MVGRKILKKAVSNEKKAFNKKIHEKRDPNGKKSSIEVCLENRCTKKII